MLIAKKDGQVLNVIHTK
ncbi:TPA: hypothetical protein ACHJ9Z_RS26235 [Escherichia coli]